MLMKTYMFHMNAETACIFYERVEAKELLYHRKLDEIERTEMLVEMAKEGLIEAVIGTNRTKEEVVEDLKKHSKVLDLRKENVDDSPR